MIDNGNITVYTPLGDGHSYKRTFVPKAFCCEVRAYNSTSYASRQFAQKNEDLINIKIEYCPKYENVLKKGCYIVTGNCDFDVTGEAGHNLSDLQKNYKDRLYNIDSCTLLKYGSEHMWHWNIGAK